MTDEARGGPAAAPEPPAARPQDTDRPGCGSGSGATIATLEGDLAATRDTLRRTAEALRAAEAAIAGSRAGAPLPPLPASLDRIAAIYETLPGYVIERDPSGRILGLNGLAASTMGTSVEGATGRHMSEFGSPDTVAEVLASDAEVLRLGRPVFGITQRYRNPDGSEEWLWVNKTPLVDPETGARSVLAISHVITELKAAEAERAELPLRRIEARIAEELGGFRFRHVAAPDFPPPDGWFEGLAPAQAGLVREVLGLAIEQGTDTLLRIVRACPDGRWAEAPAKCVSGTLPSGQRFAVLGVGPPDPVPPRGSGGAG